MRKIFTKDINVLDFNSVLLNKLYKNNIITIYDLCKLNRKILKDYGLSLEEIKEIIIKLQLNGLDLSIKKSSFK